MDPNAAYAAIIQRTLHVILEQPYHPPHRNGHACTVVARRTAGRIILYISATIPTVETSAECVPSWSSSFLVVRAVLGTGGQAFHRAIKLLHFELKRDRVMAA
jgi:hypothetical protein